MPLYSFLQMWTVKYISKVTQPKLPESKPNLLHSQTFPDFPPELVIKPKAFLIFSQSGISEKHAVFSDQPKLHILLFIPSPGLSSKHFKGLLPNSMFF